MEAIMEDTIIRKATSADAAEMLEYLKKLGGESDNLTFGAEGLGIDTEAEAEFLGGRADSYDCVSFVAVRDSRIVGEAGLDRLRSRMSHRGSFGIGVLKEAWGCGIGSALTEHIISFARDNGFEQIELEVRRDNIRAIRLYEKYGFKKIGEFPRFFKIDGEYVDFDLMILYL